MDPDPVHTRAYDVVVIGCGMAGLAAGLAAAEVGRDVAVLEKSPERHRGGHTRFTESFRIPTAEIDGDHPFDVGDYTAADFYTDVMRVTDGRADPARASTLTEHAAATFAWMTDHGIEWEYRAPHPGYTAGRVWLDGEAFVASFVDLLADHGVDVLYDAAAFRLTYDEHRTVTGVVALHDGDVVEFRAGAVVLASGGYESNAEKRVRYYGPGYEEMKVRGSRYNTGEAVEMALDLGAKLAGQWSGAHMAIIDAASPDVEGGITRIDGYQYGIIVNHDGRRFVDEGEDSRAHTYAKFGRIVFEQPYHEAFIVVDSKVVDDVAHMGPTRPVTADSIEALARRVGIEAVAGTVETVEAFNEACDPDAVRTYDPNVLDGNAASGVEPPKSNWALPIDEPPFTAYPITGGITFGFGGVAATPDGEVLDTRDEVIPGLYAAGNATGGLFYGNYPGGTGLTNAAVFGRIAGERAAAFAVGD